MSKTTATVTISTTNELQKADKAKKLQAFANLPDDDQERLNQLIANPKALKALKDKWAVAKMMFG